MFVLLEIQKKDHDHQDFIDSHRILLVDFFFFLSFAEAPYRSPYQSSTISQITERSQGLVYFQGPILSLQILVKGFFLMAIEYWSPPLLFKVILNHLRILVLI